MNKREPVSKKTRFEVFKRDKFTCQYCGAKAPEVVLHADHIHPVAEGGQSDILNLVTACAACNGGKGARKLDDRSAVEVQRTQLEELEARREQLEMMLAWRDVAQSATIDEVEEVSRLIGQRGQYLPNESGKADIRRWLKRFSFPEIVSALDASFDSYMEWKGDEPCNDAWNRAFAKIPAVASIKRQEQTKPYLTRLFYIQGILRKRWRMPQEKYVSMLKSMHVEWGAPLDLIEAEAKHCDTTAELWASVEKFARDDV